MNKAVSKEVNKNGFLYRFSTKVVKLTNLVMMLCPFIIVWYEFYADKLWVTFFMRGHWLIILLFAILYYEIGRVYEAFKISYHSRTEMIYSQLLTCFEVDFIMYIVAWLLIRHAPNVIPMIMVFGVQICFAILWSCFSQAWYFHVFPADRTIVIWDERQDITDLIQKFRLNRKYQVVKTIKVEQCVKDISIINDADTVFLAGIRSHDRNTIVKYCLLHNVKAFLIPRVGDLIVAGSAQSHMFNMLLLKAERYSPPIEYVVMKRFWDIILSIVGLVVLAPLVLITAVSIKLEDGGSVFYRQRRLTKNGKEFDIIKFRSMRVNAEEDGVARLSTGDKDERVTKVGRIIRKFRVDEIPQLLNVIMGDMTIVGPRAERPELTKLYQKELPEFALRLQTKAGLTGYAQVYGRYNTTPYDKLLMDLMYIANASIFEDIRIIFATVKILFMPGSTEGIKEGHRTALGDTDYANHHPVTETEEFGTRGEDHE